MTSDRLSLDLIARRWSAEADQAGIQARDIADKLVSAALAGEFDFGVMPIAKSRSVIADDLINDALGDDFEFGVTNLFEFNPPPLSEFPKHPEPPDARGAPENFDARLGVMVETFTRDGAPVNAGQLQNYLNTMKSARGATDAKARRILAREIDLSIQGFRLWLDRPEFAEWAQPRGLSRPQFIDDQGAVPSAGLPQQSKKKTGRGGRKKGSGSLAQQDQPLIYEMKRLLDNDEVTSLWAAAQKVAGRAKGSGNLESKAKRLYKRYKDAQLASGLSFAEFNKTESAEFR